MRDASHGHGSRTVPTNCTQKKQREHNQPSPALRAVVGTLIVSQATRSYAQGPNACFKGCAVCAEQRVSIKKTIADPLLCTHSTCVQSRTRLLFVLLVKITNKLLLKDFYVVLNF